MNRDWFEDKAPDYEKNSKRVQNVDNIARAIIGCTPLNRDMHLMDFGSGTGLLLERIAPYVGKITAVDVSPAMNAQLRGKRDSLDCELDILEIDLEHSQINGNFDGIISSMTMHHVEDVAAMLARFHALLKDDGFIAIADLDAEDGSFHSEDTGVHHHGFAREAMLRMAGAAGFRDVSVTEASIVRKPQGDYPVFLLKGIR